jgi:hypothetical protein
MKKAIMATTIIPICLGLGNTVIAEDSQSLEKQLSAVFKPQSGNDFIGIIGVKSWFNKWDLPFVLGEGVSSYNSETETTLIPALSFRYKNFFVSGSYFPKTDYSFGEHAVDFDFDSPFSTPSNIYLVDSGTGRFVGVSDDVASVKIPIPVSISAERSEWDINVGYYLYPSLAVTAGYKRIERQVKGHLSDDFTITFFNQAGNELVVGVDDLAFTEVRQDNKTDGLMLGIASAVPLQGGFAAYGNFAFGWLKTTGDGEDFDSKYYLGELGLLYYLRFNSVPVLEAASVSLGYRFQFLDDDVDVEGGATDSTKGFSLAVNIVF